MPWKIGIRNPDKAIQTLGDLALLDDPQALADLEKLANEGNHEAHNQLGKFWEEKGEFLKAIEQYKEAQAQPFGHAEAYENEKKARESVRLLFSSLEKEY